MGTTSTTVVTATSPVPARGIASLVALGGLCGLAWAAGLRGFMALVAGADHHTTWVGTFGWVLVPGAITGALLGWAEYVRRTGGRRRWRWQACAPLTFLALPGPTASASRRRSVPGPQPMSITAWPVCSFSAASRLSL